MCVCPQHATPQRCGLRLLVAGDQRAESVVTQHWPLFSSQDTYIDNSKDMLNFCSCLSNKLANTTGAYDVVLIFSLHLSLVHTERTNVVGRNIDLLKSRKKVDISHLLKLIKGHTHIWRKRYPIIKFIWMLPYPIDFHAYNHAQLDIVPTEWRKISLNKEDETQSNIHYWDHIREILGCWKSILPDVQSFPMHVLFFESKQAMLEYSHKNSCLPSNLLVNGVNGTLEMQLKFRDLFEHYFEMSYPEMSSTVRHLMHGYDEYLRHTNIHRILFSPTSIFEK